MKSVKKTLLVLIAMFTMAVIFCFGASAYESGIYTYTIADGEATIEQVSKSATGKINIPSNFSGYPVTTIGKLAFFDCGNIESLTIPNSVITIDSEAFIGCSALKSVKLGSNVKFIGKHAFSSCDSLIDFVMPDSVVEMGDAVFSNCRNLKNVTLSKNLKVIARDTFCYCYRLENIVIPDGVEYIGESAFYDCADLTEITIPDSVTMIGETAFMYCDDIQRVKIGKGLECIGNDAFKCYGIKTFTVDKDNKYYSSDADGVLLNKAGNELVLYTHGKDSTHYTVASGITTIGWGAFKHSTLERIKLPATLTDIGNSAFYGCTNLQSIALPVGLKEIGTDAFGNCTSLKSVTIPDSVEKIWGWAFSDCTGLQSVKIGNSVNYIGYATFSGCTGLKSVLIPDSVETIEDNAFNSCKGLETLVIGSGVTEIGEFAFRNCSSLENVAIPDGVTSIDWGAFSYCGSLKYVTIPTSVTYFGNGVFECSGCKIFYKGTGYQWYSIEKGRNNPELNGDVTFNYTIGTPASAIAEQTVNSVTLTWELVPGARGYRIFVAENGKWVQAVKSTAATKYTLKNLASGTRYNYAIRAYEISGGKVVWAPKYITVKTATQPALISKVNSTKQTATSITLSWDKVSCTGYRVFRYNSATKAWDIAVSSTKNNTATITGLKEGTNYIFAVRPFVNTGVQIIWAKAFTKVTTSTMLPSVALKVASTAKNRATIAWGKATGATGYQVYYSTNASSGYKKIANYTTNSAYQYKLTSGKTYYYRVRAYKAVGGSYVYGAWSPVVSVKIK